jgi:hypothetical protein
MTRRVWAITIGTTLLTGLAGCRTPSPPGDGVLSAEAGHPKRLRIPRDPTPAAAPRPIQPSVLEELPIQKSHVLLGGMDHKKPPSILQSGFPDGPNLESAAAQENPSLQPVVAEKPSLPRQEPLLEAFRCVLENRPNDALEHLKSYDHQTQEVFLRLLPPMALLAHKRLEQLSPTEVAVLHEQLQGLMVALRPRTELAIGKMCFCEWIKSYGVYRPLPESHMFQAGVGGQPGELVQLYVEVHNFCSEKREPYSYHETRLSSLVEVADADGKPRWRYPFDDVKQPIRSLARLHDFFNNYSFHIPPDIGPGIYTVTIQIADETVPDQRRVARKSLRMVVRAP